jgi:RNA polymerase sigma-70 factor, ECF subfamily
VVAAARQLEVEAVQARTEALYREYGTQVAAICRSLLRDRAEAEDATQQVFLSVHRALLGGAVPREPLAWLATIARRECWGRTTRVAGAPPIPAEVANGSLRDVENVVVRNAEVAALWLAIADLPRPQREALLLREIRGLSYLQLGEALAVSAPAARSLLARARRKVRLRLRELHTAAGGIPLVETLARLVTSGINPAAPAARMAALGLVAGGAIIAPTALEHHVRRPAALTAPSPPRAAKRISRPRVQDRVAAARHVVPVALVRPVAVPLVRRESHRTAARRPVATQRRGGGEVVALHHETSSGGDGPSMDRGDVVPGTTAVATAPGSSSGGHDGGHEGSGGSGGSGGSVVLDTSGSGGVSHDGGGGGSDGGGSGSDGGGSFGEGG